MKQNLTALIITGVIVFSLYGCGNKEPDISDNSPAANNTTTATTAAVVTIDTGTRLTQTSDSAQTSESTQPAQTSPSQSAQTSQTTESFKETAADEKDTLSFAAFKNREFYFASGAGGWSTTLNIHADGSFSGTYHDGEMGSIAENYPNGTIYQCDFSGQFTQPVKVNEYTYSMQIRELNYTKKAGEEEIKDGTRYCYSDAYGLDGAKNILIYMPGAPLTDLPEDFRRWIGYYNLSDIPDTQLPFYALNNEEQQYGFSSYDITEHLKENISYMEEWAESLESYIKNDVTSQNEYNEKTKELYDLWDQALNEVWNVLKKTKDEATMRSLTAEELDWIARKEQAVAEAGEEYGSGSMRAMIVNQKAAELTKDRVYELLKLVE